MAIVKNDFMKLSNRNTNQKSNTSEHYLNIGLSYMKEDGSTGFMSIPGIVITLDKIQEITAKNPELKDLALAIRLIQKTMDKLNPGETAIVSEQLTSKLQFQVRRANNEPTTSSLITEEDEAYLDLLLS